MRFASFNSWWWAMWVLITACSSQRVIPEELEPLVDRSIPFHDVAVAPDSYRGTIVVFGGEVLRAKRLKKGTQIELLQLPLDKQERPILDRQQSHGRFFAIRQEFLDPATLVKGTMMTIVGELSRAKTEYLDDGEYRYPVLDVRHLHIWPAQSSRDQVRPYPGFSLGVFGGTGGRIGGGFGLGF